MLPVAVDSYLGGGVILYSSAPAFFEYSIAMGVFISSPVTGIAIFPVALQFLRIGVLLPMALNTAFRLTLPLNISLAVAVSSASSIV